MASRFKVIMDGRQICYYYIYILLLYHCYKIRTVQWNTSTANTQNESEMRICSGDLGNYILSLGFIKWYSFNVTVMYMYYMHYYNVLTISTKVLYYAPFSYNHKILFICQISIALYITKTRIVVQQVQYSKL